MHSALHFLLVILVCHSGLPGNAQSKIFLSQEGLIRLRSDAPQELIKAESKELKGAMETQSKTFTFKVRISSFEGFNSQLQRTHFNENYLESTRFPEAAFKGKLIEEINWNTPGKYAVRAKGMLNIHGVEQERIIRGSITVTERQVIIDAAFTIFLSDYNIPIPRIVKEKLAEEIKLDVHCAMLLRE
jgi:YceI-like domain